jgi:hypothetical protein
MSLYERIKAQLVKQYDLEDFAEEFKDAFTRAPYFARKRMLNKLRYKPRGPKHNKIVRLPEGVEEYAQKFVKVYGVDRE